MKNSILWLKVVCYLIFVLWVLTAPNCGGGPIGSTIIITSPAGVYYLGSLTSMYATFSPSADEVTARLFDANHSNVWYDHFPFNPYGRTPFYHKPGITLNSAGYWSSDYFTIRSGLSNSASLGFNVITVQGSQASDIGSSAGEWGVEPRLAEETQDILAYLAGEDPIVRLQSPSSNLNHEHGLNYSVSQPSIGGAKVLKSVEYYARAITNQPWVKGMISKVRKYEKEFGEVLRDSKDLPHRMVGAIRNNLEFLQSQTSASPKRFTQKQITEFSGVLSELQQEIDLKGKQNQAKGGKGQEASTQVLTWIRALQTAEGKTLKEVLEDQSSPTRSQSVVSEIRLDNYPNPFNPNTVISYSLPTAGYVAVRVYDLSGRLVQTLVNRDEEAGNYLVKFDGTSLSSGIYFVRIETGGLVKTIRISLLK